jgi:hypothetical protein
MSLFLIRFPEFQKTSRFSEDSSQFSNQKFDLETQGLAKSARQNREKLAQKIRTFKQNYDLERCFFS